RAGVWRGGSRRGGGRARLLGCAETDENLATCNLGGARPTCRHVLSHPLRGTARCLIRATAVATDADGHERIARPDRVVRDEPRHRREHILHVLLPPFHCLHELSRICVAVKDSLRMCLREISLSV